LGPLHSQEYSICKNGINNNPKMIFFISSVNLHKKKKTINLYKL
jgi:hypothetical protein